MNRGILTLAASLCLLGLLGAASVSNAQNMTYPHKVTNPLFFRTTGLYTTLNAADPQGARRGSGTTGYIDSLVFNKPGGLSHFDTTASFNMQWANLGHSTAILDTNGMVMRLALADAGSTSGIDSFYVIPQVSVSGSAWESAGLLINTLPTNPTTGASILTAAIPVALLPNLTGSVLFKDQFTSRTGVDIFGLGTWNLCRFIIVNDISATGTTANCNFKGSVTFFSATDSPNK